MVGWMERPNRMLTNDVQVTDYYELNDYLEMVPMNRLELTPNKIELVKCPSGQA